MSTQEGPRTDKVRKTESQSVLQLRESAVTITQTHKQENDKKEQEIIWSNTCFVLIKKKKSPKMGKEEGTQVCFIKKENKNQSRSSFDPISSSNYDLLALSYDISSNPASRGLTINIWSWANYLNDLYLTSLSGKKRILKLHTWWGVVRNDWKECSTYEGCYETMASLSLQERSDHHVQTMPLSAWSHQETEF